MSYEKEVENHYQQGDLLNTIRLALDSAGKTTDNITHVDLAPVDEFHIGGRQATDHLFAQLDVTAEMKLLDVGCGLGGAARYVALQHGCQVSGIDLTDEYISTGQVLSEWLGMSQQVNLVVGSALNMPYESALFDGAYMLHVGMNIENKMQLFKEVHRVLKPGSLFAVYDIMKTNDGDLLYPVPWATSHETSFLATPGQYADMLTAAGFVLQVENNRRDFGLDFFAKMAEKTAQLGGPPAVGLHLLMQASTAVKIPNMIKNITNGCIAPVELIVSKQ